MKRVFLNIIKQSRHYTMTMNAFVQRQQQAEQTVQLLKQELAALAQIAGMWLPHIAICNFGHSISILSVL